jgi:hypothetical protein
MNYSLNPDLGYTTIDVTYTTGGTGSSWPPYSIDGITTADGVRLYSRTQPVLTAESVIISPILKPDTIELLALNRVMIQRLFEYEYDQRIIRLWIPPHPMKQSDHTIFDASGRELIQGTDYLLVPQSRERLLIGFLHEDLCWPLEIAYEQLAANKLFPPESHNSLPPKEALPPWSTIPNAGFSPFTGKLC